MVQTSILAGEKSREKERNPAFGDPVLTWQLFSPRGFLTLVLDRYSKLEDSESCSRSECKLRDPITLPLRRRSLLGLSIPLQVVA